MMTKKFPVPGLDAAVGLALNPDYARDAASGVKTFGNIIQQRNKGEYHYYRSQMCEIDGMCDGPGSGWGKKEEVAAVMQ